MGFVHSKDATPLRSVVQRKGENLSVAPVGEPFALPIAHNPNCPERTGHLP